MAVQKSKVSRASRGARRSHDSLKAKGLTPTLSEELETGEAHRRHHVSPAGYYKGKQVIMLKKKAKKETEESSEA